MLFSATLTPAGLRYRSTAAGLTQRYALLLGEKAGLRAATEMDMDQLAALHGYVQDKRPSGVGVLEIKRSASWMFVIQLPISGSARTA